MPGQNPAQQRSIMPNQTGQRNARLEKIKNIFRRQEAGKGKKVSRGPGIYCRTTGAQILKTLGYFCVKKTISN
jgi:hypothetical protein